jgi:hypothetical protein
VSVVATEQSRRRLRRLFAWLTALAAIAVLAPIAIFYVDRLPSNMLPWKPVDLTAPPQWLAHAQLNALARNANQCHDALDRADVSYTPLADKRVDDACGFTDVMRLDRPAVAFRPNLTATCGLDAALVWYSAQVRRAARDILRSDLVAIEHVGVYACRNVNSEQTGPRSEHATANAIDITAFRLADGRVVSVAHDYGKATPQGRFLDAAHEHACTLFNTVLGPRYNALHATHFHLDMGRYRVCA